MVFFGSRPSGLSGESGKAQSEGRWLLTVGKATDLGRCIARVVGCHGMKSASLPVILLEVLGTEYWRFTVARLSFGLQNILLACCKKRSYKGPLILIHLSISVCETVNSRILSICEAMHPRSKGHSRQTQEMSSYEASKGWQDLWIFSYLQNGW